jgi:pSer/pThr/pTyr-binding forkhead associated (FHA) protein
MPTISILFKDKVVENYQITKGDTFIIGRNSVNDIVIDNLAVSAQHAKVESDGNGFVYIDLNSENGSFLDEARIQNYWLNDGDEIAIGKHFLKFLNAKTRKLPIKKPQSIVQTMQLDTKKFRELMKKNQPKEKNDQTPNESQDQKKKEPVGVLSFLSGNKKQFKINNNLTRIGKDPQSDILVKGFGVGKTAAIINKMPDGWHISYVEGLSRPQVNNKPLKKSMKLENMDIVVIGSTKVQFFIF